MATYTGRVSLRHFGTIFQDTVKVGLTRTARALTLDTSGGRLASRRSKSHANHLQLRVFPFLWTSTDLTSEVEDDLGCS